MRYGIFSDVHSNIEAFSEAVKLFKKQKIDKYIFLGDIVGYGANPLEVIDILKELNSINIAGNHDWASVEKFDIKYFNDYAREAIIWTKSILRETDKIFLRRLPLIYEEKNFICVHGSLYEPQDFRYVSNYMDVKLLFSIMKKHICFIGHSHKMESYIFKKEGISRLYVQDIYLEEDSYYIFNVGSVGQPRDGDNRGCICVYDSEENSVIFFRFPYDIRKASLKIINAGLPSFLGERLYRGR